MSKINLEEFLSKVEALMDRSLFWNLVISGVYFSIMIGFLVALYVCASK